MPVYSVAQLEELRSSQLVPAPELKWNKFVLLTPEESQLLSARSEAFHEQRVQTRPRRRSSQGHRPHHTGGNSHASGNSHANPHANVSHQTLSAASHATHHSPFTHGYSVLQPGRRRHSSLNHERPKVEEEPAKQEKQEKQQVAEIAEAADTAIDDGDWVSVESHSRRGKDRRARVSFSH